MVTTPVLGSLPIKDTIKEDRKKGCLLPAQTLQEIWPAFNRETSALDKCFNDEAYFLLG